MEMRFNNPVNIMVGSGVVAANANLFAGLGKAAIIVTDPYAGKLSGALADVEGVLKEKGIKYAIFDEIGPNPAILDVERAANKAKEIGAEFVIAIGGGSCIDAGKICALLCKNDIKPVEKLYSTKFFELAPSLPIIAIGTTSGTGSEVTPFAVTTEPVTGIKRSTFSPYNFAKYAFGDPQYTATVPVPGTISTALDALSHCLDAYFQKSAHVMTKLFAVEGIKLIYKNLVAIDGKTVDQITPDQRAELYIGSIYGGYAIALSGTTWTHSFGYHLTENYKIPHGIATAVFLPPYLELCKKNAPAESAELYAAIGISYEDLVGLIKKLAVINIPKVSDEEMATWVKEQDGKASLKGSKSGDVSDPKEIERLCRAAIGQ